MQSRPSLCFTVYFFSSEHSSLRWLVAAVSLLPSESSTYIYHVHISRESTTSSRRTRSRLRPEMNLPSHPLCDAGELRNSGFSASVTRAATSHKRYRIYPSPYTCVPLPTNYLSFVSLTAEQRMNIDPTNEKLPNE